MSCDEYNISALSSDSHSDRGTTLNEEASITMKQFSQLFDMKINSLRETLTLEIRQNIKSEMFNVSEQLKSEFSSTTDFLAAKQYDTENTVQEMSKTISRLESDKAELRVQVAKLQQRIGIVEKSSRSLNLEIQAVPERHNEDVVAIVKGLCDTINVPISDGDIRSCRRIAKLNPTSSRPRTILATLPSERVRDVIISGVKRFNRSNKQEPLNSRHLGVPGDKSPIFVSEHLSAECKDLHAAARMAAKEKRYKYVWVKFGRVYMRKDDTSPALHIKNKESLEKNCKT
ncbi:uncharacterized protein LOC106131271 [Amyelois transitella]|uniref:uncharacterized protein LOC106131271 n=1 Tax=Amyelois transitella TaxID=680683 RepID=UPI00298F524D|nr:uncharacterized protein LOC106131271 [Amyelois transitella]